MSAVAPDGSVTLSPLECALILLAESDVVARWRRDGLMPPDLLTALGAMRLGAASAALASPPHKGVLGPRVPEDGSEATQSEMTVKTAAEVAQVTEHSIRKAIHSGRISGRRIGDGSWVVAAGSVDQYMARREAVA
jgi:excisionase family DNA binding protein